jgi:transposase-like protein
VLGVSSRGYHRSIETLPDELGSHSTSKSATSRCFVAATKPKLEQWLHRGASELSVVAILVDGPNVAEHTVVAALGIDETGQKHPLGLWLGATENATVCGALLNELIERGSTRVDALRRHAEQIERLDEQKEAA